MVCPRRRPSLAHPAQAAVRDRGNSTHNRVVWFEAPISATGGALVYLNVDGRIRGACAQAERLGGRIMEPIHALGPHGFRALVVDCEGNRGALHSTVDA